MTQKLDEPQDLTSPPSDVDNDLSPTKRANLRRKEKERLQEFEKQKKLMLEFLNAADAKTVEAHLVLAKEQGAKLGAPAAPVPALWAERTTGREVSPADFIRQHYGQTREDGTWDPMGLTRKTLGQLDYPLYLAFATWIKRHPEDAFDAPPQPRPRATTQEEALERRLEGEREASHRYRQKKMLNI